MRIFLAILSVFIVVSSHAQLFQGENEKKDYTCYLKINLDSTIIFVVQNKTHICYQESVGTIKHLSDSIYLIRSQIVFGYGIMENDYQQYKRFGVFVESNYPAFKEVQNLTVRYYNGKDTSIRVIKGKHNDVFFNQKLYSKKHPFVTLYTGRKNPLTGEEVYVKLFIGASADFSSLYSEKYQVSMRNNLIQSAGEPPIQIGNFKLNKSSR